MDAILRMPERPPRPLDLSLFGTFGFSRRRIRAAFALRTFRCEWRSESASFRGLTPGKHRFEARAMDRNANIDPHPASFGFNVLRAWYAQPGVLFCAAFSGTIIVCLMVVAVRD